MRRADPNGVARPVVDITNTRDDDTLAFIDGASTPIPVSNSYVNALPSANIKFNVTDRLITRVASSQTVRRPTLTDLEQVPNGMNR